MPRRRKSAEENAARGNPGRRRNVVAPVEALPVLDVMPPAEITPAGKKWWFAMAPLLINLKILRASDAPLFMMLCESFGRYSKARDALEEGGYTYNAATVTGGELRRIDPLYAVLDRERRMILNIGERFGMTPVDRQRLLAAVAGGGAMMTPNDPKAPAREDVETIDLLPESAGALPEPRTVGGFQNLTDE